MSKSMLKMENRMGLDFFVHDIVICLKIAAQ